MLLFVILVSFILGIYIYPLSQKVLLLYPCAWMDIICKKTSNITQNNRLRILFALLLSICSILIYLKFPNLTMQTLFFIILLFFNLITISIIDYKINIIPDILIIPSMLVAFGISYSTPWITNGITESLLAGSLGYIIPIISGSFFYKKSEDAIGGGDVKLLCLMGLFLGIINLSVAIIISAIFSALYCKKFKTKKIPYAPFILISAILSILINF